MVCARRSGHYAVRYNWLLTACYATLAPVAGAEIEGRSRIARGATTSLRPVTHPKPHLRLRRRTPSHYRPKHACRRPPPFPANDNLARTGRQTRTNWRKRVPASRTTGLSNRIAFRPAPRWHRVRAHCPRPFPAKRNPVPAYDNPIPANDNRLPPNGNAFLRTRTVRGRNRPVGPCPVGAQNRAP